METDRKTDKKADRRIERQTHRQRDRRTLGGGALRLYGNVSRPRHKLRHKVKMIKKYFKVLKKE